MELFKKTVVQETKWDKLIDEQYDKMPTYQDDKDFNKGLELLIKMKENQTEDLKDVDELTAQEKIQDGIQIGGLIISALGIGAGLFLGIGSYKADDNLEQVHGRTWNLGQKMMDKATNVKR